MSDTPPDPGQPIYRANWGGNACGGIDPTTGADATVLTIQGVYAAAPYQYTFQADRSNIMGYTSRCSQLHTFSLLQIERMHQALASKRSYLVR